MDDTVAKKSKSDTSNKARQNNNPTPSEKQPRETTVRAAVTKDIGTTVSGIKHIEKRLGVDIHGKTIRAEVEGEPDEWVERMSKAIDAERNKPRER